MVSSQDRGGGTNGTNPRWPASASHQRGVGACVQNSQAQSKPFCCSSAQESRNPFDFWAVRVILISSLPRTFIKLGEQGTMLISCYQCRQQLDLPDDSAGKRVRCPHCQYVIVAPAQARPMEADAPAIGMPSLELDGDAGKPSATKVSPLPLPPPLTPIPNEPAQA